VAVLVSTWLAVVRIIINVALLHFENEEGTRVNDGVYFS
jgi:hypothetical protein